MDTTNLENALYLLTNEIRELRAELKLTTHKELLLAERMETERTVKRLVGLHSDRQKKRGE